MLSKVAAWFSKFETAVLAAEILMVRPMKQLDNNLETTSREARPRSRMKNVHCATLWAEKASGEKKFPRVETNDRCLGYTAREPYSATAQLEMKLIEVVRTLG